MKICIKIYWILTKEIISDIGSFSEVLKKSGKYGSNIICQWKQKQRTLAEYHQFYVNKEDLSLNIHLNDTIYPL